MTPKTIEALKRLQSNTDFQEFINHLESECNTATAQLISAPENELRIAQGRVQTYKHILLGVKQNV